MHEKNSWKLPNLSVTRCRIRGKVRPTNPFRNTSWWPWAYYGCSNRKILGLRLRSLEKLVRKKCWECKRLQQRAFTPPVAGQLPDDRTTPDIASEQIDVDFAVPIKFRMSNKVEAKVYICIFACSLSRTIHLELLPNLERSTFIMCLKRYITRRGRPRVVYSDNGGAFIKASKWLEQLRKDEKLRGLAEEYEINWKFILSRGPWWGGQFERLIGVVKSAMFKVIGKGHLTWDAQLS